MEESKELRDTNISIQRESYRSTRIAADMGEVLLDMKDSESNAASEQPQDPVAEKPFTDTTPDAVTLTEVDEIDPHCGVVNDKKF